MTRSFDQSREVAILEQRLLRAHREADGSAIAAVYREAADLAMDLGDEDRAGFLTTQAWIFALEAGDPLARDCHKRLQDLGRV